MIKGLRQTLERNTLYWTLQISGWGLYFMAFTIIGIIWTKFDWLMILNNAYVVIVGLIISHAYRDYIKKRDWEKLSLPKLATRIIFAPLILALIWEALFLPVSLLISPDKDDLNLGYFLGLTFNLTIIMFIWNLIYFFYKLFTDYKQSEIEKWRLMAAVKDAQLMALKSQINPHFIFNSLNNIRSLVIENPENAREMITHLSSLLRYSIQFNNTERVTLSNEIDIVRYYLNLESIQFEDRLRFHLNVEDKALNFKIPPMAIQMLVENAIKHGISKLPEGGEISVDCRIVNDELVVEVVNTGQIQPEVVTDSGIGLRNATERLKLIFGKLSELTLENINQNQVRARFSVPINQ